MSLIRGETRPVLPDTEPATWKCGYFFPPGSILRLSSGKRRAWDFERYQVGPIADLWENEPMNQADTLEQFVDQQLKDGVFASYDEMVLEALRLLQEKIQADRGIADELHPAYERGVSGHPGISVSLEDVKLLSQKFRDGKSHDF